MIHYFHEKKIGLVFVYFLSILPCVFAKNIEFHDGFWTQKNSEKLRKTQKNSEKHRKQIQENSWKFRKIQEIQDFLQISK